MPHWVHTHTHQCLGSCSLPRWRCFRLLWGAACRKDAASPPRKRVLTRGDPHCLVTSTALAPRCHADEIIHVSSLIARAGRDLSRFFSSAPLRVASVSSAKAPSESDEVVSEGIDPSSEESQRESSSLSSAMFLPWLTAHAFLLGKFRCTVAVSSPGGTHTGAEHGGQHADVRKLSCSSFCGHRRVAVMSASTWSDDSGQKVPMKPSSHDRA